MKLSLNDVTDLMRDELVEGSNPKSMSFVKIGTTKKVRKLRDTRAK